VQIHLHKHVLRLQHTASSQQTAAVSLDCSFRQLAAEHRWNADSVCEAREVLESMATSYGAEVISTFRELFREASSVTAWPCPLSVEPGQSRTDWAAACANSRHQRSDLHSQGVIKQHADKMQVAVTRMATLLEQVQITPHSDPNCNTQEMSERSDLTHSGIECCWNNKQAARSALSAPASRSDTSCVLQHLKEFAESTNMFLCDVARLNATCQEISRLREKWALSAQVVPF
jgi:hypothetical protein